MLKKIFLILSFIFFSFFSYSQSYKIYIKPHIVTDNQGNNGVSEQYVNTLINGAESTLTSAGLNVDIETLPVNFIKNSNYVDLTISEFNGLVNLVSGESVYHVVVVRNFTDNYGRVPNIPSNKVVVREAAAEIRYETLAHELCHCFGLYHTYHNDGDDISDTPVDNIFHEIENHFNLSNCTYTTKGQGVNSEDTDGILIHNLMSIGKIVGGIKKCPRNSLTPGQRNSVHQHLASKEGIRVNMSKVLAKNDFGGGFIKNNNIEKPSPVILVEAPNQTVNFEAFDQNFDENGITYKRLFQEWVGDYSSYDYLITPSIPSSDYYEYTAKFLKEFNITLENGPYYISGELFNNLTVVSKVEEEQSILVSPGLKKENGIDYLFEKWDDNNSTIRVRAVTPNNHIQYSVTRKGYANTLSMNIHFIHNLGENITLQFNDHPNANVTQYKIYRKIKNVAGKTLIATLNRGAGTYTVEDPAYKATNGVESKVLIYNVQAYYNVDQTWSDPDENEYTVGENVAPDSKTMSGENNIAALEKKNGEYTDNINSISNYPNPFNPATRIKYSLKQNSRVKIVIYNILGQEVVVLVDEEKEAGIYNTVFDAVNLPSGIYYCRITADNYTKTIKLLLSK
ncbi:MAG: zinc-dependent metalloprotease [Rhodothermaceae bacterium]